MGRFSCGVFKFAGMESAASIAVGSEVFGGQWADLGPDSRVWVFVADRRLTADEGALVEGRLNAFTSGWAAHQVPLVAGWNLWGLRVLIISVDESVHAASGCSVDAMTHAVRDLGAELGVDWFNRMQVIYRDEEGAWTEAPMHAFWALRKAERVGDAHGVLNTLVKTKSQWEASGVQPFSESWHATMWR